MPDRPEVLRAVIHPWHMDHFGHMNVRHYGAFFDDAAYHLWTCLGLPYSEMLDRFGVHAVSAQVTTRFKRELVAGDLIVIDGAVLAIGGRSATFELRMHHADTGTLHATCEIAEVIFDPKTRRSAPLPDAVRAALSAHLVPPVQA